VEESDRSHRTDALVAVAPFWTEEEPPDDDEYIVVEPATWPARAGHRQAMAIGLIIAGVALVAVATGIMTRVPAEARIVVGWFGLAGMYTGVDRVAKRRFGSDFPTGLWLSVAYLVVAAAAAVCANWLPLAESTNPSKTFQVPVLAPPDLLSRHPFGTDSQGLDVLGGIIHGLRVSLIVGIGAVAIGLAGGRSTRSSMCSRTRCSHSRP
jgi:peptide/nickel transport system permease protein